MIHVLEENFPLILSTVVSIVAVCATIYQSSIARKNKITDLYFSAQLKAYTELYKAIGNLDQNYSPENISALITASQSAMLISTHQNAEIISNFYAVYLDFVEAKNKQDISPELMTEFKNSRDILNIMLREELLRFDNSKRKVERYLKREIKTQSKLQDKKK